VAAVSGFLSENDCFIIESAQFGDPSTMKFFLRCEFSSGEKTPDYAELSQKFGGSIAKRFGMWWQIQNNANKPKLMIMVSKASHCLNDLLYRHFNGTLKVEIPAVISNHQDLKPLCDFYRIPYYHLPVTPETKLEQEEKLVQLFEDFGIDLLVLARYMQVLSPKLCERFRGQAINIHHSFLPSFKGARPYHQAYDRGVKIIGATAHYVTSDLDEGPIIEQEVIRVDHSMGPEALVSLGCDIENLVLAKAVRYHIENRVLLNGSKTVVFK
jgi:formyltetrahydrofolate deformylase